MRAPRRHLLLATAAVVFGGAVLWSAWRYGATESWAQYRLFLLLAGAALPAVWSSDRRLFSDWRGLALAAVGLFLLVQVFRLPTLEAAGYTLAAVAWLGLVVGLALTWGSRRRARALVTFLLLLGAVEAVVGIAQGVGAAASPGALAGEPNLVSGTLFNRNHFAGLLNMVLPFAVAGLAASLSDRHRSPQPRSERYARGWLAAAGCSLIGLAVLLSRSRGGILTLTLVLLLMAALMLARRGGRLAAGAVLVVLLGALGLGGALAGEGLVERLDEGGGWRPGLYRDTLAMIAEQPLGYGPGMYRWRFLPYQTVGTAKRYDHAHNDYLEVAADWGVPVAALLCALLVWRLARAVRRYTRDDEAGWLSLGCAGAIFSILVHSLFDFNLQIPTNLLVFSTVVALAWSLDRPAVEAPAAPRRSANAGLLLALALTAALLLAGWHTGWRAVAAGKARSAGSIAALSEASRWDPHDPGLPFRLGIAHRDALVGRDLDAAISLLERAVKLNPYNPRYRSELAVAHELARQPELAEARLLEAVEISPRRPYYRWRLANLYLRRGELARATPLLRELMDEEATLRGPALALLLGAGADAALVDSLWPEGRDARRALFSLLVRTEQFGSGPVVELAARQWPRLLADEPPLEPAAGIRYLERLVAAGRRGEAGQRWLELAAAHGHRDPEFADGRNALWNGGFELPDLGGPFDWVLGCRPAYCVEIGTLDGERFLAVRFDGTENLALHHTLQSPAVEPGGRYRISLRLRSRGLTTEQGVFVRLVAADGRVLFETPRLLGDSDWQELTGEFTAPASDKPLELQLRRLPSRRLGNRLAGSLWVDEVLLSRQS